MTTTAQEIEKEQEKEKELNSYKGILKSSSFFGGVQIFNILITLIRGKFVAIILGPEGMGISSLLNSASNAFQRIFSFGLNQSIVKEVASENDVATRETLVRSSLRITNLTALTGMLICMALCLPLSKITFGEYTYWWQFLVLGVAIGLGISGAGKLAVLQALHEVKRISKSSIIGGLTGLGIGIPLYYLFGFNGIVFSIVAVFLSLFIFYSVSLKKSFRFTTPSKEWKYYVPAAKKLFLLGIVLMSGEVIANIVTYVINMVIRMVGNMDDVGLYQAANSITSQFTSMIFAVLALDYFPRLSKAAADNEKMKLLVNRQSEIVSWLITPAMSLLILASPLIIRVLLAESFHTIIPLMRWMGLGMLIRAFSFPMAYITFAKGNKKVFFILEGICANLLTLVISCLFFYWFGLIGLGYALVADNGICFILYYIVNRKLYGYNFSRLAALNFSIGAVIGAGCFVFSCIHSEALAYSLMSVASAGALIWSFFSFRSKIKTKEDVNL